MAARRGLFSFSANTCRKDRKAFPKRASPTGEQALRLRGVLSDSAKKASNVKKSDAQAWFVKLHDEGLKRNTISVYKCVLQPAFEMAVDDDAIRKNPFRFNLSDLLPDDEAKRVALTPAQQKRYLSFIKENGSGIYYDDIVILMETGLRVSELYGITLSDVDLFKRRLYVQRQLCRTGDKPYFVCPPKSSSGIRTVPLSNTAYEAFKRVITNREKPQVEMVIDGYGGFLFLDSYGKPKVAMHLENYMATRSLPSRPMCCVTPSAPICSRPGLTRSLCSLSWDTAIRS